MPFFSKPSDPLLEQEKALRRRLEELEADLRKLATQPSVEEREPQPARSRVRTPPVPLTVPRTQILARPSAPDQGTVGRFNEQGIRKFDLVEQLRRLGRLLSGPNVYNRQMIRMLAAGSIDGLPVLRRERKKALLRFLFLFTLLLSILWGIGYTYFRDR